MRVLALQTHHLSGGAEQQGHYLEFSRGLTFTQPIDLPKVIRSRENKHRDPLVETATSGQFPGLLLISCFLLKVTRYALVFLHCNVAVANEAAWKIPAYL